MSESGRRYYNPSLGRWLGRDPIEEKGGLHLYGFCSNNGVNKWDYLGMHDEWKVVWQWSGTPDSSWVGSGHEYFDYANTTIYRRGNEPIDTSLDSGDNPGAPLSWEAGPTHGMSYADYRAANFGWMDGLLQYGDSVRDWAISIAPNNAALATINSGTNERVSNNGGQSTGVRFQPDADRESIIQTVAYLWKSETFRNAWNRVVESSVPVRVGTLQFEVTSSAPYGQTYPQGSRIIMWFDPTRAAVTSDGRTLYPAHTFAHEVSHVLSLMNPAQREIDATTYSSLFRAGSVEEANAVSFANQVARELGASQTRTYREGTPTSVDSPIPPGG